MRVMQLDAPARAEERPLHARERPVPEPGPGEVLIRVRACAVCRTDLHVVEGDLPPHRQPVVPGHQVVGTVERFGPPTQTESHVARVPATGTSDGGYALAAGDRVGVPWLHGTDGTCRFCTSGR